MCDKKLKPYLEGFEVFTVNELEWNGIKNGALMALCEKNGFDLFLTLDKNMMFQQNIQKLNITIVILNSLTSKIEELILFLPSLKAQLPDFEKSRTYIINK